MVEKMDRQQAWALLNECTKNPALIRHGLCVEAAMRYYAALGGHDVEQWGMAGLLHDFDYERFSNAPEHTREGAKILREAGCDEEVVGAMLSHVPWNQEDYPRDRAIRKTLFACDELCGFIFAAALVRPTRMEGMDASGVIKKMKQKAFAASVSREDIHEGAALLELPLERHVSNCIQSLQTIAVELGLTGE
ncbi:MAG: HDIG domain-containing metalloprotein [Planctomycetota bacterium]